LVVSKDATPWKKFKGSMKSEEGNPIDRLIARLKLLILFHLGADAITVFSVTTKGLSVSIEHGRVEPFELKVDSKQLTELLEHPDRLETIFLDLLVKYRRG
jgi:hypothetical protein